MHALIRQGNGKYYVSAVFGYYRDIESEEGHRRYPENIYEPYYVVFDPGKTHLIRWSTMQPDTEYLIPQLLIVDSDRQDWILADDHTGGVHFLTREAADKMIAEGTVPQDILEKCLKIDRGYIYNEYPEVINEKDIENLYWASGGFHDAYIQQQKLLDDGILYLKFDGTWGCTIEVWFWGDLAYSTDSRDAEFSDPYWFGSTVILQNGFVYFVDGEDMRVEDIGEGYCWFRARHMKYHIIPD
ncbi:MAG TPA: hypothetical protein DF613_08220 [Lachnospiraceae bacterium]|nr:hypothetical protein [Lachnospiraceae bacterium]